MIVKEMNFDGVKMSMAEDVARKYGLENFKTILFINHLERTDTPNMFRYMQSWYKQLMEG